MTDLFLSKLWLSVPQRQKKTPQRFMETSFILIQSFKRTDSILKKANEQRQKQSHTIPCPSATGSPPPALLCHQPCTHAEEKFTKKLTLYKAQTSLLCLLLFHFLILFFLLACLPGSSLCDYLRPTFSLHFLTANPRSPYSSAILKNYHILHGRLTYSR